MKRVNFKKVLVAMLSTIIIGTSVVPVLGNTTSTDQLNWNRVEDNSEAIVYKGEWSKINGEGYSAGEASISSKTASSVTYSFKGTGVRWIAQKNANYGNAKFYLDGLQVGNPSLKKSGDNAMQQSIFGYIGLDYGVHTIEIIANSDQAIEVDAFEFTTDRGEITPDTLGVTKTHMDLKVGEVGDLMVSGTKGDLRVHINVASGNSKVATFDKFKVTGVGVGSTTLTAYAGTYFQKVTVKVTEDEIEKPTDPDQTNTYKITCNGENGFETSGAGTYKEGETVILSVIEPDDGNIRTFDGFYEGETLLTKDRQYKFQASKDRTITAKGRITSYFEERMLRARYAEAQLEKEEDYTKESWEGLALELNKTKDLLSRTGVSKEEYKTTLDNLEKAINALVKRSGWVKEKDAWTYWKHGTMIKNDWLVEGGVWYYFGANGAMVTGWQVVSGQWYYFNGSGVMLTGWFHNGGIWYYLGTSGAMRTGWVEVSGNWYYMNGSGAMLTGWMSDGGFWYYLDGSGVMLSGWITVNGKWYYMNTSGVMTTGWQNLGGVWYYLDLNSGEMFTGWKVIAGRHYYFHGGGNMAVNEVIYGYYVNHSGEWVG